MDRYSSVAAVIRPSSCGTGRAVTNFKLPGFVGEFAASVSREEFFSQHILMLFSLSNLQGGGIILFREETGKSLYYVPSRGIGCISEEI
jgi:hypothetical protein